MATNLAKLKGKGTPPPADVTPDIVAENPRGADASMRPIQFRVSESVFQEFSEQAGREFGFNKGAKSQLFLKLWTAYKTAHK
ncbi:hypothetical protein [Geminicoccus roseus]|uniref:hypothetical protein n=1 Tax=Geminicoccus roseus TaxID=404900 RepID=UPI0012FB7C45|nr:hypothetical protein [Geminicoccus roseus]